jgi:hypothetical protein
MCIHNKQKKKRMGDDILWTETQYTETLIGPEPIPKSLAVLLYPGATDGPQPIRLHTDLLHSQIPATQDIDDWAHIQFLSTSLPGEQFARPGVRYHYALWLDGFWVPSDFEIVFS